VSIACPIVVRPYGTEKILIPVPALEKGGLLSKRPYGSNLISANRRWLVLRGPQAGPTVLSPDESPWRNVAHSSLSLKIRPNVIGVNDQSYLVLYRLPSIYASKIFQVFGAFPAAPKRLTKGIPDHNIMFVRERKGKKGSGTNS
jgi:hypothetical protein